MITILSVLILASSICLIVSTIIAEPADNSPQQMLGGGTNAESFWQQNKGSSKEALINKVNIIASIVLAISLIIMARIA